MSGESIRVILRVRPLNSKEVARGNKCCVKFVDPKTVMLENKPYNFDAVLPLSTTQLQAYEIIGKPIVDSVLAGYNGTIFAYGQTSSGKTHTMEGYASDQEHKGLIPRIVEDIFQRIANMDNNLQFIIKISYMEIYMERIKDCLDPKRDNLPIGETKDKVPFVKGVTERFVGTPDEVIDTLDYGRTNRTVAATNMNAVSSRSHAVFTMTIESEDLNTSRKREGKVYLVDLAGSEKVAKTGAEGTTLDEAKMINKSLSTLGQVINALVEGLSHVPYRNSKLTRILQNSLGGNSKTTLVICCSPAEFNLEETRSTLYFGVRAKSIKNNVTINEQLTAEEWKARHDALMSKYKILKNAYDSVVAELKRWRSGDKVPEKDWVNLDNIKDLLPAAEGGTSSPHETPIPVTFAEMKSGKTSGRTTPRPNAAGGVDSEVLDALYREMDLKDEEINIKSQEAASLKEKLSNLEKTLEKIKSQKTTQEVQLNKFRTELEASKGEVKEILTALEELAQNYDQKATEVDAKTEELEKVTEQLNKIQSSMKEKDVETKGVREAVMSQKKQIAETLKTLLDELGEAGEAISPHIGRPQGARDDSFEAEVIAFRLYIGKIKTEASSIQRRIDQAERQKLSQETEFKEMKERHNSMEIRFREMKSKLEATRQSYKDTCKAKKDADEKVSNLLAEIAKMEISLNMLKGPVKDADVWKKMQSEMNSIGDVYKNELSNLRDLADKLTQENNQINAELAALNAKNDCFGQEKSEYELKIKELSEKLATLEHQAERREDAKRELKGLEDNVIRELQTLHNLRKLFVADLKTRIQKASSKPNARNAKSDGKENPIKPISEEENSGNLIQKERIAFLESNLENLTKVHKHLVRDNSELRCELPKLEKRLKATMERVKQLENALKDSKDSALRDRKRYQLEVEKIKEQIRTRQFRSHPSNIMKPIRAGGGQNNAE